MRKVSSAMIRRFQYNLMRKIAMDDMERERLLQIGTGFLPATQEERDAANERLMNESVQPIPESNPNLDMDSEYLKYAIDNKLLSPEEREKAEHELMTKGIEYIEGVGWTKGPHEYPPAPAKPDDRRARIKAVLKDYAPWVGGGAGLGALIGGGIGYGTSKNKTSGTLLGTLIGGGAGAGLGGLGKYLYNRHAKK